jgi:hypothetical protein
MQSSWHSMRCQGITVKATSRCTTALSKPECQLCQSVRSICPPSSRCHTGPALETPAKPSSSPRLEEKAVVGWSKQRRRFRRRAARHGASTQQHTHTPADGAPLGICRVEQDRPQHSPSHGLEGRQGQARGGGLSTLPTLPPCDVTLRRPCCSRQLLLKRPLPPRLGPSSPRAPGRWACRQPL